MAVVHSSVKIAGMANAVFKTMTLRCEIGVNGFFEFVKTLVALSGGLGTECMCVTRTRAQMTFPCDIEIFRVL